MSELSRFGKKSNAVFTRRTHTPYTHAIQQSRLPVHRAELLPTITKSGVLSARYRLGIATVICILRNEITLPIYDGYVVNFLNISLRNGVGIRSEMKT